MTDSSLFKKGILVGVLLGLLGWSFFAFLSEGITRLLIMIGERTGFTIFFDELFQNGIIFVLLVITIIILVGVGLGIKKVKKVIAG